MNYIQDELYKVARNWKLHRIRPSNNSESPAGRPDCLFFLPETTDTIDHGTIVNKDDLTIAEELCGQLRPSFGCTSSFLELAKLIMEDNGLQMPRNPDEAKSLYIDLLLHISALR